MTDLKAHPDHISNEGQSTEEEPFAHQTTGDIDSPLPEPRPSFKSLFKKFGDEDARHEKIDDRASNLRLFRRRMHGRKKQAAEQIRKRIDPEDIRSRMRYVPKLLQNSKPGQITVGYINVEALAWKVYGQLAVDRFHREAKVFLDDIIQQMTLLLLDASEGNTESWYRQRASEGVINFVQSGAFNSDNKDFASRKGWSESTHSHRLTFTDNNEMLENRFFDAATYEGKDFEDGNNHKSTFDNSVAGDIWGNRFTYKNRGHWFNRLSTNVQHLKFIDLQQTQFISPAETALIRRILRGDDFEMIILDSLPEDQVNWEGCYKKIEALRNKAKGYKPVYEADEEVADSVQQLIRRFTGLTNTNCGDLYSIRAPLKAAIRSAINSHGQNGWKDVRQRLTLDTEDQAMIVYEQYLTVVFERARLSIF